MQNYREVILRDLSRRIKNGEPIKLAGYFGQDPANADERVQDEIIKGTLRAVYEGKTPAFSGVSGEIFVDTVAK